MEGKAWGGDEEARELTGGGGGESDTESSSSVRSSARGSAGVVPRTWSSRASRQMGAWPGCLRWRVAPSFLDRFLWFWNCAGVSGRRGQVQQRQRTQTSIWRGDIPERFARDRRSRAEGYAFSWKYFSRTGVYCLDRVSIAFG